MATDWLTLLFEKNCCAVSGYLFVRKSVYKKVGNWLWPPQLAGNETLCLAGGAQIWRLRTMKQSFHWPHSYVDCVRTFCCARKIFATQETQENFEETHVYETDMGEAKRGCGKMSVEDKFWKKTITLCDQWSLFCLCAFFLRKCIMLWAPQVLREVVDSE